MPLPQPLESLDNSCSAIFNNTLYTYTPSALQSLYLGEDAEWFNLESGVSVSGGVCVKTTPVDKDEDAALWIIGGVANSTDYKGLQKYTFSTGKWATIEPNVPVTQNRLWHSAVYLNASDTILMYAGTQDGTKQPSSQTFTINATEPHVVLAYESSAAPAIAPELIPFSQSKALYVGGSETNTQAFLFSSTTGWKDSNSTLANPFYNSTNIHAIVINGDDGSKNLYTFDMTKSPNQVNRTIIVDAEGNPVQNAVPVVENRGTKPTSKLISKRGDLTVENWPTYNDTLVPSSTRSAYSIARDQSGLVVISGGNEQDVLCMFRARKNMWVNATQLLSRSQQDTLGTTSIPTTTGLDSASSSAPPTPAETSPVPASTTTAAAGAAKSSADPKFPVKVLGAVLGSILGIALILVAILIFLRWRRKRRNHTEAGHQRRSSGLPSDEKNAMDFMDRGLPRMASTRQVRGHEANPSAGSNSSVAILMGRSGTRRGSKASVASDSSDQFNKNYNNASAGMPQDVLSSVTEAPREEATNDPSRPPLSKARGMPSRVRGSTRRSSGWNRYWSGGSSLNILGLGGSRRTTMDEGDQRDSSVSAYSTPRASQITQHSAMPVPLNVPVSGRPELNRVMSGSPTLAVHSSTQPLTREQSGTIERQSGSSFSSYTDDRMDAFSSGVPASVHEQRTWTPVNGNNTWDSRAPSQAYTASLYPRDTQDFRQDLKFPIQHAPERPPPPQASDMSWLNLGNDQPHYRM
jgi:hypothetical protein